MKSVIQTDKFDDQYFQEAKDLYIDSENVEQQVKNLFPGNVFAETFQALNKTITRFNEDICPELGPVKQLLEMALKTPEFQQLRNPGELLDNIITTITISPWLIMSVPDYIREQAIELSRKLETKQQAQKELEAYMDYMQALQESSKDYSAEIARIKHKANEEEEILKCLEKETEQLSKELSKELSKNQATISNDINRASQRSKNLSTEITKFVKAFSSACGGNGRKVNPDVANKALEMLRKNNNISKIADMLGYLRKEVVDERKVNDLGNVGEISEFRNGKLNLATIAPQELVRMVSPSNSPINIDFNIRALNNKILNMKRESEWLSTKGKGPLIIIRDESGSMMGNNDQMAKGIEWSLLEIAKKQRREFFSIPFSGYGEYHVWTPPKKVDPDSIINHFKHNYGGGTEPYSPLVEALKIIKNSQLKLKADILVITDGVFDTPPHGLMENIKKIKEEMPLKIFTILVNVNDQVARQFSDKIIRVEDLWNNKKEIAEIITDIQHS